MITCHKKNEPSPFRCDKLRELLVGLGLRDAYVEMLADATALRFLKMIPEGTPLPDFGQEDDGDVTMEWHRDAKNTLSVSVDSRGRIAYAGAVGGDDVRGGFEFDGTIEPKLLNVILAIGNQRMP